MAFLSQVGNNIFMMYFFNSLGSNEKNLSPGSHVIRWPSHGDHNPGMGFLLIIFT